MSAAPEDSSGIKNWPLQIKLGVGFGIVALLLVLNTAGFLILQGRQDDARAWTTHTYEVLGALQKMEIDALNQRTAVRSYILTGDATYLVPYEQARADFDKDLAALRALTIDNVAQQGRFASVQTFLSRWRQDVAEPLLHMGRDAPNSPRTVELIATGRRYFDSLRAVIDQARSVETQLLEKRSAALTDSVSLARVVALALLLLGLLVSAYAIRIAQRLITRPIVEITGLMTRLAAHDRSIDVPRLTRGDEIGAIARALQAFKLMAIETHALNWVKSNVGNISARLQQAATRQVFAEELAGETARLLECGLAVFYGYSEPGRRLEPLGGFGLERNGAAPAFPLGDGLVGQCARQQQTIVVTDVPEAYARIRSGLGDAVPRTLLLVPLLLPGRLLGVLELASFGTFDATQRRLIDELLPIAALALDNLQRALQTRSLLDETQAQSDELQSSEEALRVQQEELRATNEALQVNNAQIEEQSARLRASEEELKRQTEELQVANEELTEKGAILAEQKLVLEELNRDAQAKADALARASQYKSEFLANMSHELRTPLNSLLILSRSLADNEEEHLDTDEVESAQIIHRSGSKLLQLINDILDLSKVEAGKMELVHDVLALTELGQIAQRNFRHLARERGLSFDVEIEDGLPPTLHTDAARLEQIVNNLLANAFKFTREGGVRLRIARPETDLVLPDGLPRERTIAISVIDTGIGIPSEKFHRMFQSFEQIDAGTSRQYGGTGLGLSIARGMARLLGGDVTMQSAPGAGSRFIVLLPEAPLAAVPLRVEAGAPPAPMQPVSPAVSSAPSTNAPGIADDRSLIAGGDTVILIVEDDPVFARILAELIRRKGYRVLAAADGESGLALARQFRPGGMLLDVMLPGMDGWTVLDRMKADPLLSAIPVHFISATDDVERGLDAGAIGFLTKPVTKVALIEAFDRLLQQAPANGTRRVLLIDDSATSRHAMRSLLTETGVELVDAASGEEALALIGASSFDCIVLDLGLPGMSGYEFLERASKVTSLPPVVIHSGHDLSREENLKLRQYTDSIVIKGARSPERLLDEVSLFLHSIRPVAPAPREVDTGLNGRTVLVVDDDMRNIFALSKALRSKGLKVLMAQDGHKALRQIADNADIELVLMDIMMPGMDGYETMREIRKQPELAALPIIALTAKAMRGDREKCLESGANDYLSKPIDVDKLLSMMRVWMRPLR